MVERRVSIASVSKHLVELLEIKNVHEPTKTITTPFNSNANSKLRPRLDGRGIICNRIGFDALINSVYTALIDTVHGTESF